MLPQTALRVWDALLCEGGKVLYRVALALLRAAEPDLVAQDNAGDVLRVAKAAAAAAHDRDALMKVRLPVWLREQQRDGDNGYSGCWARFARAHCSK